MVVRAHNRSSALRLVAAPLRRYARKRKATLRHGSARGLRFDSATSAIGYGFGNYELETQRAIAGHLEAGCVMYDIGANVGFFSLIGARIVGVEGRVYAFEPEAGNAASLRRNASLNDLDQIEVIEKAVWSESGTGALIVPSSGSEFSLLSQVAVEPSPDAKEVELVAIDDLVTAGDLELPSLVKIDAQGAEAEILRGMADTLRRARPVVICELHETGPEVLEVLTGLGYEASAMDADDAATASPDDAGRLVARAR